MTAPDDAYAKPKTAEERPSRSGSSTRLIVLLAILLVAGVAAGWDYLVARPGHAAAIKKLEPLFPQQGAGNGEANPEARDEWKPSTQKDVHALLGETPAATETAGAYLVERYSWRRGIPWMTYDLYVIYDDDSMRLLRNATTKPEEVDMYRTSTPLSELPSVPSDGSDMPADSDQQAPEGEGEASESPSSEASDAPESSEASPEATEASAAESPANESP